MTLPRGIVPAFAGIPLMLRAISRSPILHALWSRRASLRRPEIMAFLPALTLAAFWFGGEDLLIGTALGLPLLFALAGAFRYAEDLPAFPHDLGGLSALPALERQLGQILKSTDRTGETTGVLMVALDDLADLDARFGASALAEVQERVADRLASALRGPDLIARVRPGCFAIVLTPMRRLDLETMVQVAARLQASVAPPISLDATDRKSVV